MTEIISIILKEHGILAPLLFIVLRASSSIIPPIPGIAIDIAGIIFFGKFLGFLYAEIGVMLGAVISFYIARRFREKAVRKFLSLQKLNEWEKALSENKKFWGLVLLRLPTAAVFDYINYAAGLTTLNFKKFVLATLISSSPIMFLVYFFGGLSFKGGIYYVIIFLSIIFLLLILFNGKKTLKIYRKSKHK